MKRGRVLDMEGMYKMSTFTDIEDADSFYCYDEAEFKKLQKVSKKYNKSRPDMPNDEVIKAYVIRKVKEFNKTSDLYAIDKSNSIDFPVNRINWAWGMLDGSL